MGHHEEAQSEDSSTHFDDLYAVGCKRGAGVTRSVRI